MALAENQLLVLNILMFTDYLKNEKTVQEIVCRMESDLNHKKPIKACRMSEDEWRRLTGFIKNQPDLLSYCVQHYKDNPDSAGEVACFVDDPVNPQDVNIVFRGTCRDDEWYDSVMGCYQSDTQGQIEAAEYANGLPENYGNNITATGHSKGGNKAQYITVTNSRVRRCVSFDSQGFSKAFLEKYADEISEKAHCITAISAADDYVNCGLFHIPGKRVFLESDIKFVTHFIEFHKPNILFNEYGELNPPREQSKFSKQLSEYAAYVVLNFKKCGKDDDIDDLVAYTEKLRDIHKKLGRRFFQPIWDFFIVFSFLFVALPLKMPPAFGKGAKTLLGFIGANIEYLKKRHSVL